MSYKVKVDQQLLTDLLLNEHDPTEAEIRELRKVVTIVMVKHFSKYLHDVEELASFAILAVLERRSRYDHSYSAYNYIYTVCRNEITNKVSRLGRETLVEDILPISNASVQSDVRVELPSEIKKFRTHLTGEKKFDKVELTLLEAVNLASFINLHEPPKRHSVPEFLLENKHSTVILYKIFEHFYGSKFRNSSEQD